ncbi:MAG: hypothetical protein RXO27_02950 [Acidilobus sp.]
MARALVLHQRTVLRRAAALSSALNTTADCVVQQREDPKGVRLTSSPP